MKEPAEDRHNGDTLSVLSDRIPLRAILAWLGCFLLLRGNTLAWPCLPEPQSWPDCFPLIIYGASAAQLTIFLAIGILLIALVVNLLSSPLDSVYWLVLLLVPYWLFVARPRPLPPFGTVYLPLVSVNQHLWGPSSFVMPVSLIVSWLALRPRSLRRKWRLLATVLLLVLLFSTVLFLVLMGTRPYQVTVSYFIEQAGILGTGPLLILAGGVLLLGAEYAGRGRIGKRAGTPAEAIRTTATAPKRVNNIGFWSALLAAASPIMVSVISLLAAYSEVMGGYGIRLHSLIVALRNGVMLLAPIPFVVLMASICHYAPPEKKAWTRVGLAFAIVYALSYVATSYGYSRILPGSSQLYERLATSFPILRRYGALGTLRFVFVSLALLFTLPVFRRGGIERVIRWCFVIIGVLNAVSGLGYLLTSARAPALSVITDSVAQWVVFPIAMALVAVVFGRRESTNGSRGAETA